VASVFGHSGLSVGYTVSWRFFIVAYKKTRKQL